MTTPVPVVQAAPAVVTVTRDNGVPQAAVVASNTVPVVASVQPSPDSSAETFNQSANIAANGIGTGLNTMMTSSQTQTMSVIVPAGVKPGQPFTFLTPAGKQLSLVCPANAGPGSQLMVPITDTISASDRFNNGAAQMANGFNAAANTAQQNANGPFGRTPMAMQCPHCNQYITSLTRLENGTTVFVVAGGTCLFGKSSSRLSAHNPFHLHNFIFWPPLYTLTIFSPFFSVNIQGAGSGAV